MREDASAPSARACRATRSRSDCMRDRIACVFSSGRSARRMRTSSMATPKPGHLAVHLPLISPMIRPRLDDSTFSSCSLPSTRRRDDDTTELSRARTPSSVGPTAW